jgi:hypothetical protein
MIAYKQYFAVEPALGYNMLALEVFDPAARF